MKGVLYVTGPLKTQLDDLLADYITNNIMRKTVLVDNVEVQYINEMNSGGHQVRKLAYVVHYTEAMDELKGAGK